MFASLPAQDGRLRYAIVASSVLHVVAVALLVPVIRPLWLEAAHGGHPGKVDLSKAVYLGEQPVEKKHEALVYKSPLTFHLRQIHRQLHQTPSREAAAGLGPVLKSYPLLVPSIHDIQIALPVTTPDPEIRRSDLPKNFEGDAVVQITIDKTGKVVRTKVVQALGYDGLDLRITSTLMNWKFTPAYFDGVPVASLQEIHLHYPDDAVSG
jgi:TonB family protein